MCLEKNFPYLLLFEAFQDFLGRGDYFGGPKELFSSALAFLIDLHLFRRVREDSEQRLRDPVRRQHPPGRDGRANSQPGRQAQRGPSLARPSAGHAHKVRNITCFLKMAPFFPISCCWSFSQSCSLRQAS